MPRREGDMKLSNTEGQPYTSNVAEATKQQILKNYGKLPLTFTQNAGQTHSSVRYYTHGSGYGLFFTPAEAVFTFFEKRATEGVTLALQFLGANPAVNLDGRYEESGKVNYFIGNDPAKWHTGLSTYREIVYGDLWAGVDLIFYGQNGQLKYDFIIQPGVNVDDIQLTYRGADGLSLDEEGNLLIITSLGVLTEERPVSYQEIDGHRVPVESHFVLKQNGEGESVYGFEIGSGYNPDYSLVIDPTLVYSTYLGGSGSDENFGMIAIDTSGNAYVTGLTNSLDFPTKNPLQPNFAGGLFDAFVTKLNAAGNALVYSTYIGGSGDDTGFGIAVDASGNAYVTGETASTNFPTVNAIQPAFGGGAFDAFVLKLNAVGSSLIYSTFLGGSGSDSGRSIAVDDSGNAYVTGNTGSINFPTVNPIQPVFGGNTDAFVLKLNAAGSALLFSTYLGGSEFDGNGFITLDDSNNIYVIGNTQSANFPTNNPFQPALNGLQDAFISKLNAAGSALVYSTYFGGSGFDSGAGIAVDASGNAYVAGSTNSLDFPTRNPIQPAIAGGFDAYVAKLNAAGSDLVYSTYLGGSADDSGAGIDIDSAGNAYVVGGTESANFPIINAIQPAFGGGPSDAYVTQLNAAGSMLVYSTFLGGSGDEFASGIVVDASGSAYVTGPTSSLNFPTVNAFQPNFGGGPDDAFVAKISQGRLPVY
jgi:hypothetical protein